MSRPTEEDILAFERLRVVHRRQQEVFEKVWAALETARREPTVVVVTGPTGVGKTNLIELLRLEAAKAFKAQSNTTGRIPFLCVTAAPPQLDTFRFPDFFSSLLEAADDPKPGPSLRNKMTSGMLQYAARNMLRNRSPLVCCVDEAQHITYAVRDQRLRAHLDLVKWLAIETPGVPILLVGTYELLRFARLSGQLGRRIDRIAFTPYRFDAEDRAQFRAVLRFFRDRLPARMNLDVAEHEQYFFEGCVGAVGVLKPWFDRALRRAAQAGRITLSHDDFEETRLEYGRLETIAEEQASGLLQLRESEGSRSRLRERLGIPEPKTPTSVSTSSRTPGQRKLVRDPVGIEEEAA